MQLRAHFSLSASYSSTDQGCRLVNSSKALYWSLRVNWDITPLLCANYDCAAWHPTVNQCNAALHLFKLGDNGPSPSVGAFKQISLVVQHCFKQGHCGTINDHRVAWLCCNSSLQVLSWRSHDNGNWSVCERSVPVWVHIHGPWSVWGWKYVTIIELNVVGWICCGFF